MNVLILDVGTSSMKGSLYRDDLEKLLWVQIKYRPQYNEKGELRQTAEAFEHALSSIVRSVHTKLSELGAGVDVISITAQRSSVLPLDAEGSPLMDVIMWQDTGNRRICGELELYNARISQLSGAGVNTVFSGGKMAWIAKEHPEIYEKVYKFVTIPEYLIYLMTGRFVTDFTYGSRSNLMNLREGRWDPELLKLFGVREELLCELFPPGSLCGTVTEEFSEKTGIRKGVAVITAGGDQQCAAVGQGAFREGKLSLVTGTGAFLTAACDQVPSDLPSGVICNSSALRGKYILETNVLACCSAFDWFCRNFCEEETDYGKISRELEALYGKKEECIVLPYFQGRGTSGWNAGASASMHHITLGTTRADLLKAVLEGIFMEIRNNIDLLEECVDIDGISISGGLTKSRIMNQMQADIYGLPLFRLPETETTSLGALMVTLYAMGVHSSYDEMYQRICRRNDVETYKPKGQADYYTDKRRQMKLLYRKLYE